MYVWLVARSAYGGERAVVLQERVLALLDERHYSLDPGWLVSRWQCGTSKPEEGCGANWELDL